MQRRLGEGDEEVGVEDVEVLGGDVRHVVQVLLRAVDPEEALRRRCCNIKRAVQSPLRLRIPGTLPIICSTGRNPRLHLGTGPADRILRNAWL